MKTSFYSFIVIFLLSSGFIFLTGCGKDEQNTSNQLPVARYTLDKTRGNTATEFTFDASAVSDLEDPVSTLEIRWDWENDGIFDTDFSTNKIATYQYPAAGLYFPLLQVRDTKSMTDSTKKMLVVVHDLNNLPPDKPIYRTPPDYQDYMELDVIFKWTCTDPENDPLTFELWVGRSMAGLEPVQTGLSDFEMVDGVKWYHTTFTMAEYSREYHWRIFARDAAGNYTAGNFWRFTTRPRP